MYLSEKTINFFNFVVQDNYNERSRKLFRNYNNSVQCRDIYSVNFTPLSFISAG